MRTKFTLITKNKQLQINLKRDNAGNIGIKDGFVGAMGI